MGYYQVIGTHTSMLTGYFESENQAVAEWKKIVGEDKCFELKSKVEGMTPSYFMFETKGYPNISKAVYTASENKNELGKINIYVKKIPSTEDNWVNLRTEKEVEED